MENRSLATEFASPERSEPAELKRHYKLLIRSRQFKKFAGIIPDPVLVLNRNRQIVFANDAALDVIGKITHGDPAGLRPGEALHCQHALSAACGCGTSSFCRYCGAVKAILSSLRGEEDLQECLVTQDVGDTLLFMCYTYPLVLGSENFSIFLLRDLTKERRMQILEHVFFHDIKNTLTALNGWVDLLKDVEGPEHVREASRVLVQLSSDLIDEVNAQEQLIDAESNRLSRYISTVDSLVILKELQAQYLKHDIAAGRHIVIAGDAESIAMKTDASLLKRVLSNMVRNALEAVSDGDTVTLHCNRNETMVHFQVDNPGLIPPEVQSQIFKWSFSTKGKGRGLGTFGMRLLSERYLGGRVSFRSTPDLGTRFEACYPLDLD
jgi:hypothetical protein